MQTINHLIKLSIMQNRIFLIIILLAVIGFQSGFSGGNNEKSKIDKKNCSFNGKKLYGKIKFVESFPDIRIQFVESFPDINVKIVSSFPDQCGKWQIVESFPDLKVQVVESFPDVKVKLVESFPGIP